VLVKNLFPEAPCVPMRGMSIPRLQPRVHPLPVNPAGGKLVLQPPDFAAKGHHVGPHQPLMIWEHAPPENCDAVLSDALGCAERVYRVRAVIGSTRSARIRTHRKPMLLLPLTGSSLCGSKFGRSVDCCSRTRRAAFRPGSVGMSIAEVELKSSPAASPQSPCWGPREIREEREEDQGELFRHTP
jgi:hypothetical protein